MGFFDIFRKKESRIHKKPVAYKPYADNSKYDAFISYSTRDMEIANMACNALEENGLKCWIAPRDILAGENYVEQIIDGLKNSRCIVLIFSRDANVSKYVVSEIDYAFSNKKPIIAFRVDDFLPNDRMEFYLRAVQWIDAYPDIESHLIDLVGTVKRLKDHR